MILQQDDLDDIKEHLGEWLAERSLDKPLAVCAMELRLMLWPFGITVSSAVAIIAVLKLWPTAALS